MSTSSRLGEFTYNSYLAHLLEREMRARAERVGFLDAKQYEEPQNSFEVGCEQQAYNIGWHLGKQYLAKAQEERGSTCRVNSTYE